MGVGTSGVSLQNIEEWSFTYPFEATESFWTADGSGFLLTITPSDHGLGVTDQIGVLVGIETETEGTLEITSINRRINSDGEVELRSGVKLAGNAYLYKTHKP